MKLSQETHLIIKHEYFLLILLASTYAACERLSVMQRQARFPEIFDQMGKNTLFWDKKPPIPPEIKIWPYLDTLNFD